MRTENKPLKTPELPSSPIHHGPIQDQLRRRLLALDFHAFARCLCLLLTRLGYQEVRLAGRTQWKGRNRSGGYDIEAALPAGVGRRRIIVQAKQFDTLPIFQRSVDELRGVCLRAGAAEALLITASTFSPVVLRNAASAGTQVAPVRLLAGGELLDLLVRHRVGVREEGGSAPRPRRLGLDEAFFGRLAHTHLAIFSRACAGTEPRVGPRDRDGRPSWLLTIRVNIPGDVCGAPTRNGAA